MGFPPVFCRQKPGIIAFSDLLFPEMCYNELVIRRGIPFFGASVTL